MSKRKITIIICSCAIVCAILAIIGNHFFEKTNNRDNSIQSPTNNMMQNQEVNTTNDIKTTSSNPTASNNSEETSSPTKDESTKSTIKPTTKSTTKPTTKPTSKPTVKPTKKASSNKSGKYTIVIDAGHQAHQNLEKEPIGPGASTKKAKVSSGTTGISSGIAEYIVTLQVSKKLRDELENRGYNVVMIRESNDVNISNAERASIANDANADAFIRIHCNGSDNTSVNGAETLCQTKSNPYCGDYYSLSRKLSDSVLNNLCSVTGAKKRGVSETDSMSGINWCKVPVTIVEMGFMSNSNEDLKLVDEGYQSKIVKGMADGIDEFFN